MHFDTSFLENLVIRLKGGEKEKTIVRENVYKRFLDEGSDALTQGKRSRAVLHRKFQNTPKNISRLLTSLIFLLPHLILSLHWVTKGFSGIPAISVDQFEAVEYS